MLFSHNLKRVTSCVFLFCKGWYRTSRKGCTSRRQCPQSAQYSGRHHCEFLISWPSAHLTSFLMSSDLSVPQFCLYVYCLYVVCSILFRSFFLYFLCSLTCLFVAAIICPRHPVFCLYYLYYYTYILLYTVNNSLCFSTTIYCIF